MAGRAGVKTRQKSAAADGARVARESGRSEGPGEIAGIVARNLKRLRTGRPMTLEALANQSGVSRGMLSQIELGRSVPTIALLWKVAHALGVPFAALTNEGGTTGTVLLPAAKAKILTSAGSGFTSQALFPFAAERRVEFYKLTLAADAEEAADPHAPGTTENLVVESGQVEITAAGISYILKTGDAILFEADVPHKYRNLGAKTAVMYLVMIYADTVG